MIDFTCTSIVVPFLAGCSVVNLGGRSPNFDLARCVLFEEEAGASADEAFAQVAVPASCGCSEGGVRENATCGVNARSCIVTTVAPTPSPTPAPTASTTTTATAAPSTTSTGVDSTDSTDSPSNPSTASDLTSDAALTLPTLSLSLGAMTAITLTLL